MATAIDNASFYKRAVEVFDLPADKAEKIAAQMTALGVGRDDAYMLLFLATARAEALTETLPDKIERSGAALLEGVGSSIDRALSEKLADLPALVSAKLDGEIEQLAARLGQSTDSVVKSEVSRRATARTTSLLLGAIALFILAGGYGYMIGRDTLNSDASKWAALVKVQDGGKWLTLAKLNDLDKALAQSCGPSDGRVIAGGKVCDVPLYVSAPVPTSKGIDAVKLSVAEYANALGTWGLLGVGAVVGWLLGRLRRR